MFGDIVGGHDGGPVFCRPDKLYQHDQDQQAPKYFLFHEAKIWCSI
jgi:hypothetical protein